MRAKNDKLIMQSNYIMQRSTARPGKRSSLSRTTPLQHVAVSFAQQQGQEGQAHHTEQHHRWRVADRSAQQLLGTIPPGGGGWQAEQQQQLLSKSTLAGAGQVSLVAQWQKLHSTVTLTGAGQVSWAERWCCPVRDPRWRS